MLLLFDATTNCKWIERRWRQTLLSQVPVMHSLHPPNPSLMPTPSIPSSSTTASCCFGYEGDNRMRNMGEEVKKGTMSDMEIWNGKKRKFLKIEINFASMDGWCCVDVGLAVEDTWHGTTSSPIRWWWPWIITITKQPSGPHSALLTLWYTMSHNVTQCHMISYNVMKYDVSFTLTVAFNNLGDTDVLLGQLSVQHHR